MIFIMDIYTRDLIWKLRQLEASKKRSSDGLTSHPLYKTWTGMLDRCYYSSSTNFKRYGARGISVCDRWFSLKNFIDDMKDSNGYTLDRKDNDGDYCPENCRWASEQIQKANISEKSKNKRTNIHHRILSGKFITKKNIVNIHKHIPI